MKKPAAPVPLKRAITTLLIMCVFFPVLCGCVSVDKQEKTRGRDAADTIQEEVVARISERVLREVDGSGRLRMVRERKVLRVALPPPEPPFQDVDPELGVATGFTPALVGEIALILGVKPNIEILERAPDLPSYPADWENRYDIISLPEASEGCADGASVKYYYSGPGAGWKTFCVAGDPEALTMAIEHIFSYLNETGIYIRLYRSYVEE